jgi:hypothetical protein
MATDGQKMGCKDTTRPERSTDEGLSRLHDALRACKGIGPEVHDAAWAATPFWMKLEYNYSSWTYRAP